MEHPRAIFLRVFAGALLACMGGALVLYDLGRVYFSDQFGPLDALALVVGTAGAASGVWIARP